jgi:hypothetical protein
MITHFINWVKSLFTPKKEEPIILEEIKEEIQEVVKPQRAEHCTSHSRFKKSCRPCNAAIAGLTY